MHLYLTKFLWLKRPKMWLFQPIFWLFWPNNIGKTKMRLNEQILTISFYYEGINGQGSAPASHMSRFDSCWEIPGLNFDICSHTRITLEFEILAEA